jgi:transposase
MTWQPKDLTPKQFEDRRLAAARLLKQGDLRHAEIARELGVSRVSVSYWDRLLRESRGNPDILRRHPHTGRPPRMSQTQWETVLSWLKQGAPEAGYPTDRWTLLRIQHLIHERLDVFLSKSYIRRKLHRLGWSVQIPAPQARERDEEAVRAWLTRDWPALKKRLLD